MAGQPALYLQYCEHEAGPAACANMFEAVSTFVRSGNNEVGQAPASPG
jgi:hypothetical protein